MLLYFNPGHENAVLNASPYYMPPANVVQMQHDLSFLPAWHGSCNDSTFVNNDVNKEYIKYLKKYFPKLPPAISLETITKIPNEEVSLWGISPQAILFFSEMNRGHDIHLDIPVWKDEYKYLNSRKAAKDCLVEMINKLPEISENLVPCFCESISEIEHILSTTKQSILAKAPYSSSGRGLLWLSVLSTKEKEFLHGILKKQGSVSIEPVLNKDTDFAMQFMCDGKGNIQFEGYSLFETNQKGVYLGNYLFDQERIESLLTKKIPAVLLQNSKKVLLAILKEKYASLYKGCIGVDMMVYKENTEYKLHPCLEINMRYNMGYLSMKLQQNYLAQSSEGKFRLEYSGEKQGIYKRHNEMLQQFPLKIENGKIEQGYLSLCPVSIHSKYIAYLFVERNGFREKVV